MDDHLKILTFSISKLMVLEYSNYWLGFSVFTISQNDQIQGSERQFLE